MSTTKTKKTKGEDIYPPREIRENTKARRAWLADKLEEINTQWADREGKIVGNGSYQRISVYHISHVAARIQYRGTCPGCASSVALEGVNDKRIVLHGYERPGDGYVVGRCVGVGEKPVEVELDFITRIIADLYAQARHATDVLLARAKRELASLDRKWKFDNVNFYEITTQDERGVFWKERDNIEQAIRNIEHKIWTMNTFAKHLEEKGLPKHGRPITEVLIAD